MRLEGSCSCGAVKFSCISRHPYPYMHCYCTICRKTQGGGGYAINIRADTNTLEVEGEKNVRVYRAKVRKSETKQWKISNAERRFCGQCGSGLWVFSPTWPEMIHPFASAIDSNLPIPPERIHILQNSKANWVNPLSEDKDKLFANGPHQSLAEWHEKHDLVDE